MVQILFLTSLKLIYNLLVSGKLRQSEIYKIGSVKCISLRGQSQDSERSLVTEVARLLASGTAYFAWGRGTGCGAELRLTTQRLSSDSGHGDGQFWCNKLLHLPYIRSGVNPGAWLVRLMLGSVEIRTVYSGATQVRLHTWFVLIDNIFK